MVPNDHLKLLGGGPPISLKVIRAFESQFGAIIPDAYAEFLANIANGGYPQSYCEFPVSNLDGHEVSWSKLHGLYGIHTERPTYDLTVFIEELSQMTGGLAFCFAFDGLDGHLCIHTERELAGRISYIPWGESLGPTSSEISSYHVAATLDDFWESLRFGQESD